MFYSIYLFIFRFFYDLILYPGTVALLVLCTEHHVLVEHQGRRHGLASCSGRAAGRAGADGCRGSVLRVR